MGAGSWPHSLAKGDDLGGLVAEAIGEGDGVAVRRPQRNDGHITVQGIDRFCGVGIALGVEPANEGTMPSWNESTAPSIFGRKQRFV